MRLRTTSANRYLPSLVKSPPPQSAENIWKCGYKIIFPAWTKKKRVVDEWGGRPAAGKKYLAGPLSSRSRGDGLPEKPVVRRRAIASQRCHSRSVTSICIDSSQFPNSAKHRAFLPGAEVGVYGEEGSLRGPRSVGRCP